MHPTQMASISAVCPEPTPDSQGWAEGRDTGDLEPMKEGETRWTYRLGGILLVYKPKFKEVFFQSRFGSSDARGRMRSKVTSRTSLGNFQRGLRPAREDGGCGRGGRGLVSGRGGREVLTVPEEEVYHDSRPSPRNRAPRRWACRGRGPDDLASRPRHIEDRHEGSGAASMGWVPRTFNTMINGTLICDSPPPSYHLLSTWLARSHKSGSTSARRELS